MSGDQESAGAKSHDPTERRLEKAREDGDIARSPDIDAFLAYLGLLLAIGLFGPGAISGAGTALTAFFTGPVRLTDPAMVRNALSTVASALVPLLLFPAVLVVIGLIGRRGIAFSGKAVAPKLSRIDPIKNAGQKFGATGLFNFVKSTVKLIVVSVAVSIYLVAQIDLIAGLARAERADVLRILGDMLVDLLLIFTVLAGVVAVADYLWQAFDHKRKLRMTHQELRDETKEGEGDPHVKGQRRRRAQEIAGNQMMQDMREADVVMVNPTDFAVALKWDRTSGLAPICVAKGQGELAARMREIAAEEGIPLHRDVPATRALYATAILGQQIPPDLYRAVAAAIRFADMIRAKAKGR